MSQQELHVKIVNDPMYAENGMVISLGEERPCWIIDPGLPPEAERLLAHIEENRLVPEAIVLTHAHGDHIAGIDDVREVHPDLPVYLGKPEWPMLTDPMENLSGRYGAGITAKADNVRDLVPGDTLQLDGTTWDVLDTSGHSPGGRSICCQALRVVIVGDAVFAGSIGRTDFHHSNGDQLLKNIRDNILTLPDDTTIISGHGPTTTVSAERTENPYLKNAE